MIPSPYLYGYNGDGDRLWQNTEGVTTTYTLDLNSALTQVLAQTQGGVTTSFLPGIGQEVNNTWTYFHSDALGSVRHLTGPAGQVLGDIRYSPFGEVEDSTGLAPAFGFTGEQQESTLGLVYLRARVYSPALGRFLTPGSLIPDVTNGQSLNAYAYVYNDPVNLVDPNGNTPNVGGTIVDVAKRLPVSWQSRIKEGAAAGLERLNWWYSQPDDCSCRNSSLGFPGLGPGRLSPGLGLVTQGIWAVTSEPAQHIGTVYVTKARLAHFTRTFFTDGVLRFPVADTRVYRGVSIDQAVRGWRDARKSNVTYVSRNLDLMEYTVVRPTSAKWVFGGLRGLIGTIGIGGLIDGVFQLYGDLDLCLSPAQRFNRFALASGWGMVAALGGTIAFGLATYFGASVLLTIGVGFAASLAVGIGTNYLKNRYFETFLKAFGRG